MTCLGASRIDYTMCTTHPNGVDTGEITLTRTDQRCDFVTTHSHIMNPTQRQPRARASTWHYKYNDSAQGVDHVPIPGCTRD